MMKDLSIISWCYLLFSHFLCDEKGHVCNCTKENGICFDCLTKHLWECSKSMRIFNRFRAKCPFW